MQKPLLESGRYYLIAESYVVFIENISNVDDIGNYSQILYYNMDVICVDKTKFDKDHSIGIRLVGTNVDNQIKALGYEELTKEQVRTLEVLFSAPEQTIVTESEMKAHGFSVISGSDDG